MQSIWNELAIKETTDCSLLLILGLLSLHCQWKAYYYTRLYDKRDAFNFPIVNFLFLSSNIPSAPAYGVYVSQLICYARACSNYQDFIECGKVLTTKLLSRGYQKAKLVVALRSSMGDIKIWSVPTMWQFPELFLLFFQRQVISRRPKPWTYASTYISFI